MASAPPVRQQSQRRASPEQSTDQHAPSPVRARSATSEDSQTVLLNTPHTEETGRQPNTSAPEVPEDEVKECWVCRGDSTEDTPDSSPWRNPCPCALVAHEDCLLDWVASKENQRGVRDRSGGVLPPKIQCPQCKAEIKLTRPKDLIVEAVRAFERLEASVVLPGALTVVSGMIYQSSLLWGMHSIYAVFGADDGFRILRPLFVNQLRPPVEVWVGEGSVALKRLAGVVIEHLVNWKLYVGVPLISPVLILSRTTLADSILPVLPILFFATQIPPPIEPLEFVQWPPSASLAFSLLPYVRGVYNFAYAKLFRERENEWLQQIQPRGGEDQPDANANADQQNRQDQGEDGNMFEVRIDGDIWEEWEDEEGNRHEQVRPMGGQGGGGANDEIPMHDEHAAPPPDIADNRPVQIEDHVPAPAAVPQAQQAGQQQPPQRQREGRRLAFSPLSLAESIVGALLFPTIAGLSGEALNLILPASWTTLPMGSLYRRLPARGLLQNKWGRSLVGGCLFVVCKDAIMLYVRWRMAQIHRQRRVVDVDRSSLPAH